MSDSHSYGMRQFTQERELAVACQIPSGLEDRAREIPSLR